MGSEDQWGVECLPGCGRLARRVTVGVKNDGPDRRHVRGATESIVIKKVRDLEKRRDAGQVTRPGVGGLSRRGWSIGSSRSLGLA